MLQPNVNTRMFYRKVLSTATPQGQTRVAHPYSKLEYNGLKLGSAVSDVGILPLPRYICGDGEPIPGWTGSFSPVSQAKEICRRRLVLKLRDNTASWGMNLIEYKDTLQTIATILKTVRKPITTIGIAFQKYAKATQKSGKNGLAGAITTQVIGAHLAYKFGVAPLMEDVKSTMEFLATQKQLRRRVVASSGKRPFFCTLYDPNPNYRVFQTLNGSTRCRSGASFVLSNEAVYQAESMGLFNLPAVLLDAVPLSFIVNWFWPVVTWAKDLSAFAGLTPEECWTTVIRQGTGVDRWSPRYETAYGYSCEGFYMNRTLEVVKSMSFPTTIRMIDDPEMSKTFSALEIAAQRLIPALTTLRSKGSPTLPLKG